MTQPAPENPTTKPTALFFPVMSTLIFIGLAVYELPGIYGWIYLVIALFGLVTVYLSWQGNKRKILAQKKMQDPEKAQPGDKPKKDAQ
jgi:uncharacterized membrane protein (DUF2068 family)